MSQQVSGVTTPTGSSDATWVVRTENLGFSWPGSWLRSPRPLFQGLDLAIGPGELVGLSGPSGAGKSTLGDILLGLRPPTQGRVFWGRNEIFRGGKFVNPICHGEKTKNWLFSNNSHLRCRYQKIFQDPQASFSPIHTLEEAFFDVIQYHGLMKGAFEKTETNREHIKNALNGRLEKLGLEPAMLKRYPHQLSGGEMQRMALARVMLLNPLFIVADEPTSRLDLSVQAHIIRLIADYSRNEGCAVLLITHDSELIKAVCGRAFHISEFFPH